MNKIIKTIENKKITILGAGLSGKAASNLANHLGAKVILIDNNKNINKKNLSNKIQAYFGSYPKKCFNSDLVIVSPGIDCKKNKLIKKIEENKIPIISEIEFASWFTRSKIIAITGSNGKSTAVNMLGEIFKINFQNTMIGGNIGTPFSENVLIELQKKLNNVIHILEISSYQLEKTYFFKPQISCILNISKDHLSRYRSYSEYYNTKFKIFNKNKLFYNGNDEILNKQFLNKKNTVDFSLKNNNVFIVTNNEIINKENKKNIKLSKIQLLGDHNLENIFAVLSIANEMNIDVNKAKNIIYNFKSLKHRMEIIKRSPLIINDSKSTNLQSCKVAINSFKKNITLILGGFSKDKLEYQDIINIINNDKIKRVVCYGQVGEKIHLKIKKYKSSFFNYELNKTIIYTLKKIGLNDILLFSPGFKSFDQFNNFEERGDAFKNQIEKFYKK